jgi:CMP-N-acetylneuraminic acid synthetase
MLMSSSNSAVIPVTSFPFPIFRALKIAPSGVLEMVWPEHELTRSNDLPETFHDAGQFYWLRVDSFLKSNRIYAKDALPLMIPRWRVQDIDTLEDWSRAEKIYASTQGGRG